MYFMNPYRPSLLESGMSTYFRLSCSGDVLISMKKPLPLGRGLSEISSRDGFWKEGQPIAGAIRATGVASAAARSSGKL